MSYQVLSLKYRPQTFQDVIGQPQVTTTLTNAISGDRVAHAILFSGPRGTGKTTIARILAKAMNCKKGPTPTPCNLCRSCTGITAGQAPDVFEIDGASNNSVDQIRELRENVTYMPSLAPRKIYIIDEVHMLSTAAFNALLKTLEEPPDHVMFIFATTEAHKIPITILSRCQRHDLGRISLASISAHLMKLSQMEGYTLAQESCDLIAQEGDGSMRDSLSLLDRIISSSPEKEISHEGILRDLGIIDKELLFDISLSVIQGSGPGVLEAVDKAHDMGLDLKKFYAGIIRQFRNLAVVKVCPKGKRPGDISSHDQERMESLVRDLSRIHLSRTLDCLLTQESLVKFAAHTKTAIEMVLLKLVQTAPVQDLDTMIQKLDLLARQIQGATGAEPPEVERPAPPREIPTTEVDLPARQIQGATRTEPPEQARPAPPREIPPAAVDLPAPKTKTSEKSWPGFLKFLGRDLPFIAAILKKSHLEELTDTDLKVRLCGSAFDMQRTKTKMRELERLSMNFFEKKLTITILSPQEIKNHASPGGKSPAKLKQEALAHPLVAEAIKVFNGSVVDIQFKNQGENL